MTPTTSGIGGITDGGGLFPTFVPSNVAGQTVLGCPISSFMSLDSKCPITGTGLPTCATQTGALDRGCCSSLSAFATSIGDCYSRNAPDCLNMSELSSSLTAFSATATDQQITNPCAQFASETGTSNPTETEQATETGQAAETGKATTETGTETNSASAAATKTSKSGGAKERGNIGLRTLAGLVLVGSLSVLWL
ncbi:hypothetical protein DSL72_003100 [Monilinia vaccinii-corymbosi]|uniref:Uncharacterized protein n=1 Tax=Monilinia vaccinii-corymbosi TaxID=61207 RepID=A0A8A3P1C7_9HELO|nr:hypothetical protein DSL72_003100 [Monilinia vaccinii-corymbosi]